MNMKRWASQKLFLVICFAVMATAISQPRAGAAQDLDNVDIFRLLESGIKQGDKKFFADDEALTDPGRFGFSKVADNLFERDSGPGLLAILRNPVDPESGTTSGVEIMWRPSQPIAAPEGFINAVISKSESVELDRPDQLRVLLRQENRKAFVQHYIIIGFDGKVYRTIVIGQFR